MPQQTLPQIAQIAIATPVKAAKGRDLPLPIPSNVAEYLQQFEKRGEPKVKIEDPRASRDARHKQNPSVPLDRLQIIIDESKRAQVDPLRVLAMALQETNLGQSNPLMLNEMTEEGFKKADAATARWHPIWSSISDAEWQGDPTNAKARATLMPRIQTATDHTPEGEALLRAQVRAAIDHMKLRGQQAGGDADRQLKAYNGLGKGGDPAYVQHIKENEENLSSNRAIMQILGKKGGE